MPITIPFSCCFLWCNAPRFRLAAAVAALSLLAPLSASRAETFTLEEATIDQIQKAMAAGALSSVEMTSMYLNRIAVYDQNGIRLNSVPVVNPQVFAEALAADEQRATAGAASLLHGVPCVVKDSFNVAGLPTSLSVRAFRNLVTPADAFVVARLKEAKSVILGKANLDTVASDASGLSEAFGPCLNPYNPAYSPGGSSSGSAVSVAANLVAFSLGGDTGGSIRWPADANSLVGLKTSLGVVSPAGTAPLEPDRDVLGPLARTTADAASIMDVIEKFDPANPWNPFTPPLAEVRPQPYATILKQRPLAGKRFGVPANFRDLYDGAFVLDPEVAAIFEAALDRLRSLGATVVELGNTPAYQIWEFASPFGEQTWMENYDAIWPSDEERNQWVAYYWNDFFTTLGTTYLDVVDEIPTTGYQSVEVKAALSDVLTNGAALSFTASPAFADFRFVIEDIRQKHLEDWMTTNQVDALVGPGVTGPLPAFPPDTLPVDTGDFYTELVTGYHEVNQFGLPGVTVPMGFLENGASTTLQIVTRKYADAEALAYAYAFEQATNARRPPALTPPLPGETIEYSTATPPSSRPEVSAPAVRVSASAKVTGKGRKATLVLSGRAVDASGVASLKVYVNGKKVSAKRARNWKATLKLSALRQLVRGDAKTVNVQVVARDIYGNTSVATKTVKLPKDA